MVNTQIPSTNTFWLIVESMLLGACMCEKYMHAGGREFYQSQLSPKNSVAWTPQNGT